MGLSLVLFKLQCAYESLGESCEKVDAGLVGIKWGPKVCISNKIPAEV